MAYSWSDFGSDATGLFTGGLAGNEDMGFLDNLQGGVEDYFMADTRAARAQKNAATKAGDFVREGYDRAIGNQEGLANMGMGDYNAYRQNVQSGAYGTDPSQFQTSIGNAPQFQGYQAGQAPQFQGYQMGQSPEFQRTGAGDFQFDYEQSPSYQNALNAGLDAVKGSASAQGRRFTGGAQKDLVDYASGMAAQDYGNQYNRARGEFEGNRAFDANQAGAQNAFNQNQFGLATQVGMGQSNLANQYGQNQFQFGQNLGAQQSNLANQYGQNAYQFGTNANMGANMQNYNMFNQQAQNQQGMDAGLAQTGYNAQQGLGDMYINQGSALGNAALGVGNANANSAMSTRNTVNSTLNTLGELGSTAMQGYDMYKGGK